MPTQTKTPFDMDTVLYGITQHWRGITTALDKLGAELIQRGYSSDTTEVRVMTPAIGRLEPKPDLAKPCTVEIVARFDLITLTENPTGNIVFAISASTGQVVYWHAAHDKPASYLSWNCNKYAMAMLDQLIRKMAQQLTQLD